MRSVQTKVLDSGDGPTTYMIVDSVLPEDIALLLIKANIYRIIRQVEPNISVPREIRAHLVQGA